MPNPSGRNQLGTTASVFAKEPPYGARKQMDRLEKSAKLAGSQGSTAAIQTPRRAKRHAVEGRRGAAAVQAGTEPIRGAAQAPSPVREPDRGIPELPYGARIAAAWAEIAAHPEAGPLAQRIAAQALRGGAGG